MSVFSLTEPCILCSMCLVWAFTSFWGWRYSVQTAREKVRLKSVLYPIPTHWFSYGLLMCLLFFLGTVLPLSQVDGYHVAGSVLFVLASLLQHQSMVLLARLRIGKSGEPADVLAQMTICVIHYTFYIMSVVVQLPCRLSMVPNILRKKRPKESAKILYMLITGPRASCLLLLLSKLLYVALLYL